jgi:hypothetical protein
MMLVSHVARLVRRRRVAVALASCIALAFGCTRDFGAPFGGDNPLQAFPDGSVDAAGRDGPSDAPVVVTDAQPKFDAANDAGGGDACAPACSGASCSWTCTPPCSCEALDCAVSGTCTIGCSNSVRCGVTCEPSAPTCDVTCGPNTSCQLQCRSATCKMRCEPGSECFMQCPQASSCNLDCVGIGFKTCGGSGNDTRVVCNNTDCP